MDSFNQTSTNFNLDDEKIVVFGVKKGKTNTYIVGLTLDSPTLTKTLEKMKKSFGCGGSIKEVEYDGKMMIALHLQGDKVAKATEFIENLNIGKIISKPII
jgi:translation initiation factor 1 (eIF-1/SUI1)